MSTTAEVERPALRRDHALALLHQMILIRRFEEKAAELYTVGKIQGFLHLYIGEEAVAVGGCRPSSRRTPSFRRTASTATPAGRLNSMAARWYDYVVKFPDATPVSFGIWTSPSLPLPRKLLQTITCVERSSTSTAAR